MVPISSQGSPWQIEPLVAGSVGSLLGLEPWTQVKDAVLICRVLPHKLGPMVTLFQEI